MKLRLAVVFVSVVASVSVADLAVRLSNGTGVITQQGSGGSVGIDNVLVQLIWSPTNTAQGGVGGALATGEHILETFNTVGTWGAWGSGTVLTYDDENIGGAAGSDTLLLSGYIFVRLYDANKADDGDLYLQQYVQAPTLNRYDFQAPATIYDTSGYIGHTYTGDSLTDIDNQVGVHAIPEPTVAALVGIFGGGILISRRIFTRYS